MFNIKETQMGTNGSFLSVVDDKIFGGMENTGNPDIILTSSVKENLKIARDLHHWKTVKKYQWKVGMKCILVPNKGEGQRKVGEYFISFEIDKIVDCGRLIRDDNFIMRKSPFRSANKEKDFSYRYIIFFGESTWTRLTPEHLEYIDQFNHSTQGVIYTNPEHKYSKAA